jgi:hypothetical protein
LSFSIQFFAKDVHSARSKLRDSHAPEAVKAVIELAIAAIPHESRPSQSGAGMSEGAGILASGNNTASNRPNPPALPRLCGILVETHGHIDENGGRSNIGAFRVEPFYG